MDRRIKELEDKMAAEKAAYEASLAEKDASLLGITDAAEKERIQR